MIQTTAALFQKQGYHGTGLAEIIDRSGAPKGSVYHHFPGGKEEIALCAIKRAGEDIEAMIVRCFAGDQGFDRGSAKLCSALATWFDTTVEGTGCPIAAVLIDAADTSPRLADACGAIFAGWRQAVHDAARGEGFGPDHADTLAQCVVIALEGAWILARAQRNGQAFHDAAQMIHAFAASLRESTA